MLLHVSFLGNVLEHYCLFSLATTAHYVCSCFFCALEAYLLTETLLPLLPLSDALSVLSVNKYVHPPNTRTEMYAGRVAYCPLANYIE